MSIFPEKQLNGYRCSFASFPQRVCGCGTQLGVHETSTMKGYFHLRSLRCHQQIYLFGLTPIWCQRLHVLRMYQAKPCRKGLSNTTDHRGCHEHLEVFQIEFLLNAHPRFQISLIKFRLHSQRMAT